MIPGIQDDQPNILHNLNSTTPTPNLSLSSPTTPPQVGFESPHTDHLQTPVATRFIENIMEHPAGTGESSSGSDTESNGMNTKDKGSLTDVQVQVQVPLKHGNEEEDLEIELDQNQLRRIQLKVGEIEKSTKTKEGDGWKQSDELLNMIKSVLPHTLELPLLQERLAAQKDTIATMQMQSKLSEQLISVERQRHTVERDSWHAETRALVNVREAEIAAGTRPKRLLDLDVGYHQELEAANKRLEMDNRLMAPRLADTQRQIDKLVSELRILRSNVILSSQPITRPGDVPGPSRPSQLATPHHMPRAERRKSRSPVKAASGRTTMGDARTEHLLLAARRIRTLRQTDDRVGRLTMEELRRNGVVGPAGGVGFSEGYGRQVESDDDADESEEEEKPVIYSNRRPSMSAKGKNRSQQQQQQQQGTPLLPRPKKTKKSMPTPAAPQTPSKSRPHGPPQTTPGGSNFNDLLRAAELATRPGSPTPEAKTKTSHKHVPFSAMSATRSTTRTREESPGDRGSPKRARRDDWSSGMEETAELVPTQISASQQSGSALDLLAQASQLDVAQTGDQSSEGSGVHLSSAMRLGDVMDRSSPPIGEGEPAEVLGPAINLASFRVPGNGAAPIRSSIEIGDSQIDPSLTVDLSIETPKTRPRSQSNASELVTPARGGYASSQAYPTPGGGGAVDIYENDPLGPSSFASPTGGTVPGIGKYVHLSSGMPARRVRSPYLKWSNEEDELLARAVAIHGEKWDLVSKGVPTRSYHQVRQRWLRKTGAFDKKPSTTEQPHGISNLSHPPSEGFDEDDAEGEGDIDVEGDEEDVSPTPVSAKKKRKHSILY